MRILTAAAVLLLFVCGVVPAFGQDAEPSESKSKAAESPSNGDDKTDKELEEVLLPQEAKETPADVLDRAVNAMRDVGERIEAGNAGDETRKMQQNVIADITQLIELLQNQPPPPAPDQNNPPQNNPQQNQQQQNQQRQNQQQQQTQKQQQQQPQPERKPGDEGNPRERQDKARKARQQAAERARLFKDIWGHLPEAVRNELLNNFSEEYLPKYAPEVRRYFEELAKRRRTRN